MFEIRRFKFEILNAPEYSIAVSFFSIDEEISMPYTMSLNLVTRNQIKLDDIIKKEALLTIVGSTVNRYFHGYINHFKMTGKVDGYYSYQATVVPYAWFMNLNYNYRIFQNMTVEDIVSDLLQKNQIASDEYEFSLKNTYQQRRYCTQYGESDFRFMCRILEEEGIFFFFEHTEKSHVMVFSDTEDIYEPIAGESLILFKNASNMVAEKEAISNFVYNRAACSGKVTHTNYNFKKPSVDMKLDNEGDTYTNHEIYEYPGDYGLPSEGETKVQNHLEQVKALEESVQGKSNCARFIPGRTFSISGHPHKELDGAYCLISVEHGGGQTGLYGEQGGIGGDYTYSNDFIAIPAATVYRSGKTYSKPYVRGIQTALVTGQEGSEIHTDEWGRVKVRFHWDRGDKKNDKSSCWLRTNQPWSGNGWGFVSLPRVGDEVLVAFINGDPDWPIMIGNVNNAASPALYTLPDNKTQSGIKTRSTPGGGRDNYNELRFEDLKGSEEVYLQAEKDWNTLVKNDKRQDIGNDKTETVGSNKYETVTINKMETIGLAKELTTGGMYQVTVGGLMNETVALGKSEEVGLIKAVIVGTNMTEYVKGDRSSTVDSNYSETVTNTHSSSAKKFVIEAEDEISVTTGDASFTMKSNGDITLSGNNITIKGSGTITLDGNKIVEN